jgi:protein ImuB
MKPGSRIGCLWLASSDPAADQTLLEIAERFSPRIQYAPGLVYLDLARPADESWILERLREETTARHLAVQIALGANKVVARLAARVACEAPSLVPEGKEAAFLSSLPLSFLEPSEALAGTWQRWGLKTLGDLARLPARRMLTHLGVEGLALHQRARGIDTEPFVPYVRTPVFVEKAELEWPVVELEPFLAQARPLLERLMAQLAFSGMACLRLRSPTRELRTLLPLLQSQLAAKPPAAPVIGLLLLAHPDVPPQAQLSLFGPPALSPAQLSTTLAQLAVLVGSDRPVHQWSTQSSGQSRQFESMGGRDRPVHQWSTQSSGQSRQFESMGGRDRLGAPQPTDGYCPERWAVRDFQPPPPPWLSPEKDRTVPAWVAIRVLRPAVPLRVALADQWPWQPLRIQASGMPWVSIHGTVHMSSGPWRMEERWWSEAPVQRDYWDVELAGRGLYRIFQDTRSGQWYADGMYD